MSDDNNPSGSGGGFLSGITLKDIYGDAVDLLIAKQQSNQVGSNANPASAGTPPNAPAPTITASPSYGFSLPTWAQMLLGASVLLLVGAIALKAVR
jgi:hypothetical protein